jgi:hypothetical protein
MPYLCRVTISGPEPNADEVSQMTDAVANAIEAGWDAPRVSADDDEDMRIPDDDSPNGAILDYRVFGYRGGAIILVVLEDGDLAQTSVGIAGLAQHLTSWSPGLLTRSKYRRLTSPTMLRTGCHPSMRMKKATRSAHAGT